MGEYDKAFKQFVWVFKVTDVKNVLFPSTESGAFYKKGMEVVSSMRGSW
jgi:hypothetical protein